MTNHSEVLIHIDGASRGNPGPAAYAVVMESADGAPLTAFAKCLGKATNNFAEYQALLAALDYALGHNLRHARVFTDSELMARQLTGQYKVKSPDLKPLHERARQLIARLESFSIQHVPRKRNREADRLANRALDGAESGRTEQQASERRPQFQSNADDGAPGAPETLNASATYTQGLLRLSGPLSLEDGEEVDLIIRRKR
jgi:ribonuclease HI